MRRKPLLLLRVAAPAVLLAAAPAFAQVGACCLGPLNCFEATPTMCADASGVYLGDGTSCPDQTILPITWQHPDVTWTMITPAECPVMMPPLCQPTPTVIDAFVTEPDGTTCFDFGGAELCAVPSDFFGPGSDPFDGGVCAVGVPLGPTSFGDYGVADTLILRSNDPFDRCDLPSPDQTQVDIQIVELHLQSVEPIVVTSNGGFDPQLWEVEIDLSEVPVPATPLTAVKTHCNGGTYDSVLTIRPRFTFTKVLDPGVVEVLDTGFHGCPPIDLNTTGAPWVSKVHPSLAVLAPLCTNFFPGLDDLVPITEPTECVCAPCPWDFGGDDYVGLGDLTRLLNTWGPCTGCPEDFTGDGFVGLADLTDLLNHWGPCRS